MKIRLIISLFFLSLLNTVDGQDHTKWRGPHGNGNYDETGLMKSWPENGPEVLWTFESLGAGFSSPAVVNNKIYLSGMEDATGFVYALSNDGKLLWKTAYGPEFIESYPGARSTPVIAGDLLYQFSGRGLLVCMDAINGSVKWTKDVVKEYGGRIITWGFNETPVIEGDMLYLTPGGPEHGVIALNRKNGALIWTVPVKGEKSAYCTPAVMRLPNRTLLVTHMESHIAGLDAKTGKLLWTHPHPNEWSVHANTPICQDGAVFCFSGYGQGGVKLKLSPDGSSVKPEWVSKTMDNRIGAAVLVNGVIYGSGDKNRYWMGVDWKTGEEKFQVKGLANGTVISAEGMLYGYTERGELFLAKAEPSGMNIVSKSKVTLGNNQHWAHPVIDKGRLLLRHGNALIAYKIK